MTSANGFLSLELLNFSSHLLAFNRPNDYLDDFLNDRSNDMLSALPISYHLGQVYCCCLLVSIG